TKGNILVKGIVKDKGAATLDGMIKIEKGGGGAESFLSEHVMHLNPGAHASANPELEIENNDVSSRHAASVSRIDEEKIFYLTTRGISREDAKKLIVEGFLESALGRIRDEKMRKELSGKVMAAI
ncbi:MAG: SufD family Fe-S cluster assembly protein, partial [Candidatus Micrarchaeota archaeon]